MRLGLLVIVFCLAFVPDALAGSAVSDQLRHECDLLIRDAIRRPYGWGWTHDAAAEPAGKPTPRVVCEEPLCSPAAGLVLLWAGEQLHEARYQQAAEQVVRGIVITQRSTGKENDHVTFSRAPIVNDERAVVADRAATRCALGLMLALLDGAPPDIARTDTVIDGSARGSARLCTSWLARQLTPNGFWPTAFPPGAPAGDTTRIVRLDDGDYRDSSIALLLSAAILPDDTIRRVAPRPTDSLLRLILKEDVHGPNLWNTAVTIDGLAVPPGFPRGPDVLASRDAMQTLMAAYLLTGDNADDIALEAAAKTLRMSKSRDDLYDRFLDPTTAANMARQMAPPPATQSFFGHADAGAAQHAGAASVDSVARHTAATASPTVSAAERPVTVITPTALSGTFGIPPVLDAAAQLKLLGRDRYIAATSVRFTLHQQLCALLCGLTDDPTTLALPASPDGVAAYLDAHQHEFQRIDATLATDLPGRVQRIWMLLLRTKLEATTRS